jgi:cytoskeleton-associated protein 5
MRPGAKVSSSSGPAASAVKKAAGAADDMDGSPLYAANKLKNARFRDEAKLKLLKWNFASPRQEFVDQLKEQGKERK